MYSLADSLCNLGGCLGLWVGMSIITIVEVMDLTVKTLADIFTIERKAK